MFFEFAGIRARAEVPPPVARRLWRFRVPGPRHDVEFRMGRRGGPADAPLRPRAVRRHGCVHLTNPMMRAELTGGAGGWSVAGTLRPHRDVWDTLLRSVWSWVLPERGGLLLHASGAVVEGRALIFPAVSGSGKSTLARKAGPGRMLADDTLAVVRRDGRWFACATAFYSRLRTPRTGAWPLRALFFPVKNEISVTRLSAAEAVRRLLRNVIGFGDASARLLEVAADLAASVPAAALGSLRREPFDRILERIDGHPYLG